MKRRQPRALSEPADFWLIAISLLVSAILFLAIVAILFPRQHERTDLEAMQLTINALDGRVKQLEEQVEKPKPAKKPAAKKKAVMKAANKPAKRQAKAAKASSGTYKITFYCPCAKCCGKTDGITASGTKATADRTVAAPKSFAFGEQIRIEGLGHYVVEDRGGAINGDRIDVFVNSHDEALRLGVQYREVERVHD